MNQTGVQRFAAGGTVNTRRHAYGSGPKMTNLKTIDPVGENIQYAMSELNPKDAAMLNKAMQDNTGQFNALAKELQGLDPEQYQR